MGGHFFIAIMVYRTMIRIRAMYSIVSPPSKLKGQKSITPSKNRGITAYRMATPNSSITYLHGMSRPAGEILPVAGPEKTAFLCDFIPKNQLTGRVGCGMIRIPLKRVIFLCPKINKTVSSTREANKFR